MGNIKNNLLGIYHGLSKRDLPLFIQEQQWRFNRRNIGTNITSKIQQYILNSTPMPDRKVIQVLDISEPYFSSPVSWGKLNQIMQNSIV